MCKYIVKHYWDENTAQATIEPYWISSSSTDLSEEQQKIKEISKNIFKDYLKIIKDKPSKLKIDGFEIKITYKEKKDPAKNRDRMVTDVTLCINKLINIKKIAILSGISLLVVFGSYVILTSKVKNNTQTKPIKQEIKKTELKQPKAKKTFKYEDICKLPFKQDYCYVSFIKEKCKSKNLSMNYNKYIKNSSIEECMFVKSLKEDKDYQTFIKKHIKIKYKLNTFMKGE